jgi:hypothetical protein
MMHRHQTQGAIIMLASIAVGMKGESNQGEDEKKQEEKRILPSQVPISRVSTTADLDVRRVVPPISEGLIRCPLALWKRIHHKIIFIFISAECQEVIDRGRFSFKAGVSLRPLWCYIFSCFSTKTSCSTPTIIQNTVSILLKYRNDPIYPLTIFRYLKFYSLNFGELLQFSDEYPRSHQKAAVTAQGK